MTMPGADAPCRENLCRVNPPQNPLNRFADSSVYRAPCAEYSCAPNRAGSPGCRGRRSPALPAAVPAHVGMDRKAHAGLLPRPREQLPKPRRRHRSPARAREHIRSAGRAFPLQLPRCPQLGTAHRDGRSPSLASPGSPEAAPLSNPPDPSARPPAPTPGVRAGTRGEPSSSRGGRVAPAPGRRGRFPTKNLALWFLPG